MRLPAFNNVTASAAVIPPRRMHDPEYTSEQDQLWDYYQRLEEFSAAVNWKANAISRVRLIAAEFTPGGDEPIPITEGPIADAVAQFAGGIGGQSQILGETAIHLNVPGEGWLCGVEDDFGDITWKVYSADELRVRRIEGNIERYQVRTGESVRAWATLPDDTLVVRFWRPHPRWGWKATSRAAYALSAMKELDLINRRIIAETISRMAANGVILYDRGKLSFPDLPTPVNAESVDPFAQILVDVGSKGIADPTSAQAAIKIPIGADLGDSDIRVSDLIEVIDFSNPFSERMLDQRAAAVTRLATALDIPAEQLTGLGNMNHWGAAQIEESGIKVHITPDMEMICHAFTEGYLYPTLEAEGRAIVGPQGGRPVIWYDPSEIVMRPDRSNEALEAYDRGELTGAALLRELGFSAADQPDEDELERIIDLKRRLSVMNETITTEEEPGAVDIDNPDLTETQETEISDSAPEDVSAQAQRLLRSSSYG
ncbi:MAG: hypothetical protein IJI68_01910 [Eggerthellaceae bacterium]|nr:hypothetical protein [Eggerthellaceae bacterium]